jgi:hypothetical protein
LRAADGYSAGLGQHRRVGRIGETGKFDANFLVGAGFTRIQTAIDRRAGLGHFLPSLSPVTSSCSRFVSGPSGVVELMTFYGTDRLSQPIQKAIRR